MKFANVSETDLIVRAQQGDEEAFGCLVDRSKIRVYQVAYQMTQNHVDADELSQQAFVQAFQSLGRFRQESSFMTWMYRITVNACYSHFRRSDRKQVSLDQESEEKIVRPELTKHENPDRNIEQGETRGRVWRALNRLGAEIRAAVVLVYLQDQKPKQVAVALGCSEATVHWRLFRARKILKQTLQLKMEA